MSEWFAQFGIDRAVISKVLEAATRFGADDADLYFQHSESTGVSLDDRKVNQAHVSVDLGVGIRVVIGDQVGYAYTEELTLDSMVKAAKTASTIAKTSNSEIPPVTTPYTAKGDFYPLVNPWSQVGLKTRIGILRTLEEAAFARSPHVQKVSVSLGDVDKHVLIARADGLIVEDYQPMTRASVSVSVEREGQRESGRHGIASREGLDFYSPDRLDRLVNKAVDYAVRALDAGKPPAGEMPVVMAAGSSGILLHEAIGHGMEADFNRKGISIFADRIGKRVAPPGVTIVDDGTLPGARGSINVDDEGTLTEKTVLVEDGILKSYLHDRISARHYGIESTGSGRRQSFRHTVLPRMRATYMEAGQYAPEEIIASVDRGIYCEVFQNGAVQIGAGDFSFYVSHAYLIENGKLTRPVKDVNIIGNGPKVLEAIEMVGNDLVIDEGGWTCGKDGQSVPVSQGQPTVKVSNLSVGGAA